MVKFAITKAAIMQDFVVGKILYKNGSFEIPGETTNEKNNS